MGKTDDAAKKLEFISGRTRGGTREHPPGMVLPATVLDPHGSMRCTIRIIYRDGGSAHNVYNDIHENAPTTSDLGIR